MTHLPRLLIALTLFAVPQPLFAAPDSDLLCVDLLLEIDFTTGSSTMGGEWRLVANADSTSFGFSGLRVPLAGINSEVTPQLPTGRVNGSPFANAGFTAFANAPQAGDSRDLFFGQVNTPSESMDQGVFFGVGTLINGSPSFPTQPMGTISLGPSLTTLTDITASPWGNESGLVAGVEVATGTFAAGQTPSFGGNSPFEAILFTDLFPELTTTAVAFTTTVVDNLVFGVATGDYNGDGVVDAADYTVYRDSFNQTVPALTGADGDGDGVITDGDRIIWLNNFGSTAPSTSTAAAVPEPSARLVLGGLMAVMAGFRSRVPMPANKLNALNALIA